MSADIILKRAKKMGKAGVRRAGMLLCYAACLCALLAFTRLPALNATRHETESAAPVYLPTVALSPAPRETQRGRLDLNLADAWMLTAIPGVGEQTAQRIVAYRTEHGGFCSVEELVNVEGIGQKKAESIWPYVCIGEEMR